MAIGSKGSSDDQHRPRSRVEGGSDVDQRQDVLAELDATNKELRRQLEETNQAMWALYKELDDKNAELERSNNELDQFAMIASHDLQEPLRKVIAFGERLGAEYSDGLDARAHDYIERMQNASQRMVHLISDLLSFARVTSQAQPFEPTDLNAVVAEVLSDLEERIRDENGRVDLNDLPVVEADPIQMHQLLMNLIGNGLKFHAPDRAPVVTVANKIDPPGFANILVSDNGIGFDEKYADRIFQPFRRLRGMGAYEGTGMGLAICQKIAVRHGGGIQVRSVPGKGSRFLVTLPLTQPRADRESDREPVAAHG